MHRKNHNPSSVTNRCAAVALALFAVYFGVAQGSEPIGVEPYEVSSLPGYSCMAVAKALPDHECVTLPEHAKIQQDCDEISKERGIICSTTFVEECKTATTFYNFQCKGGRKVFQWQGGSPQKMPQLKENGVVDDVAAIEGVPKYIGCFKDCTGGRDLPVRKSNGDLNQCAQQCKGYKYFGRQWTQECWCGNSYGSKGKASGCQCSASNIGGCKNCVYSSSTDEGELEPGLYKISTSAIHAGDSAAQPAGWGLSAWNAHGAVRNSHSSWAAVHSGSRWPMVWNIQKSTRTPGAYTIKTTYHKDGKQPAGWGLSAWNAHGAARNSQSSRVAVHSGNHWLMDWTIAPSTRTPGAYTIKTTYHKDGNQPAGWGLTAWQKHGGHRSSQSSWVYVHSGDHWLMDWELERVGGLVGIVSGIATPQESCKDGSTCWPVLVPKGASKLTACNAKHCKCATGEALDQRVTKGWDSRGGRVFGRYLVQEESGCVFCPVGSAPTGLYQGGSLSNYNFLMKGQRGPGSREENWASAWRPDGSLKDFAVCRTMDFEGAEPFPDRVNYQYPDTGTTITIKSLPNKVPVHANMQTGAFKMRTMENRLVAFHGSTADAVWYVKCKAWKVASCYTKTECSTSRRLYFVSAHCHGFNNDRHKKACQEMGSTPDKVYDSLESLPKLIKNMQRAEGLCIQGGIVA